VPVIVVGNWIVGGAGKTPTTLAVLEQLRARGLRAGVVSRGYGRDAAGVCVAGPASTARDLGDEPLLIHRRARVPVAVGRDRV
ncbi:tetraacyldisaccharide 4'-kinase, partial [Klebsiella quasipneumoniae]